MSAKAEPRNPKELTDADFPTMTEEEQALYLEANKHRLGEIFDLANPVTFEVPETATTTLSIRLKTSELTELSGAADARGMKLSSFIREAALTIARNPQVKALPTDAALLDEKVTAAIRSINDVADLLGVPAVSAGSRR